MTANNPFLALLGEQAAATVPILQTPAKDNAFDSLAEKIFRLTLKSSQKNGEQLFYMKDLAAALKQERFDQDALDQAVLEYAVGLRDSLVNYIYECFERFLTLPETPEAQSIHKTIFVNLDLAFSQMELFPDQKLHDDLIEILAFQPENTTSKFLASFVQFYQTQEASTNNGYHENEIFKSIFLILKNKLANMHLLVGNHGALDAVLVMSKNPTLAEAMVTSSILDANVPKIGKQCEETLLGSLFLCSCIPRIPGTVSDFFDRPSRSPPGVHTTTESNIWASSERAMSKVHKIFYNLFKSSPKVQDLTRTWIGILKVFSALSSTYSINFLRPSISIEQNPWTNVGTT